MTALDPHHIPEQWKPENQDPAVAYTLDELSGTKTPFKEKGSMVDEDDVEEAEHKPRARKKPGPKPKVTDPDDGPGVVTPADMPTRASAEVMSHRELGS